MKSRIPKRRLPSIRSATTREIERMDYRKGVNNYAANDILSPDHVILAQDARINQLGTYQTKDGDAFFSTPFNEIIDTSQISTTGHDFAQFSNQYQLSQPFTAVSNHNLTSVKLFLRNTLGASGVVGIKVHLDNGGFPGLELADSSFIGINATLQELTAYFIDAPKLTAGLKYHIVLFVYKNASNKYEVQTTSGGSDALLSQTSGGSWASTAYALKYKVYVASGGPIKGIYSGNRNGGVRITVAAHDATLYSINEATGSSTAIVTGLNAAASQYVFKLYGDKLYFVNGIDNPKIYDFASNTSSNIINTITSTPLPPCITIEENNGFLYLVPTADRTKVIYSKFADFTAYTATAFIHVPSPNSPDPITALHKYGGNMFIFTRSDKHVLYGDPDQAGITNGTLRLSQPIGRKGTFSQKSTVQERDRIYFMSDDGLYEFNGVNDKLLSQNVYNELNELEYRTKCVVSATPQHVTVYYPKNSPENDAAVVYNLNLGVVESFDTARYVSCVHGYEKNSQQVLAGHNKIGLVTLIDKPGAGYNLLGKAVNYAIHTVHEHYDRPSAYKRIRYWRPRVVSVATDYNLTVGYAIDMSNNVNEQDISLSTNAPKYDANYKWDSGLTYGSNSVINEVTTLHVPGVWRRCQLRYSHKAPYQPITLLGNYVRVETMQTR
jgi:hypothetical protein